jgi:hypothetical protein
MAKVFGPGKGEHLFTGSLKFFGKYSMNFYKIKYKFLENIFKKFRKIFYKFFIKIAEINVPLTRQV